MRPASMANFIDHTDSNLLWYFQINLISFIIIINFYSIKHKMVYDSKKGKIAAIAGLSILAAGLAFFAYSRSKAN